MTLRADFYDAPLSVPGFGDLLAARTEAITPMSPDELERAIVAPAEQAGVRLEPRLLAEMIAEVADQPGALPLLQYALTELVERADGRGAHARGLPADRPACPARWPGAPRRCSNR